MRGKWMLGDKPLFHKREVNVGDKPLSHKRGVDVRGQAVVIGKGSKQAVVIRRVRNQASYQEKEG
jgi:hypothetical protein